MREQYALRAEPDRELKPTFLRPIVRGKAGKRVEFGAKMDIGVCDGWARLEALSFDAYNEAVNLGGYG